MLRSTRFSNACVAALSVAAIAFVGCDRAPAAETELEDTVLPDVPAPAHDAPSVDSLREAHPDAVSDEGSACADDRDCASPLRCLDSACFWPAAMTGEVDESTPYVEFVGERRERTRYYLEVAAEPWETTRGLMHRNSMVEDMGMVFVFDRDSRRTFWMRNTYIPLDMVFVTDAGLVDSFVENAEPRTETTRPSDGPARFVVELNAGEVARMGLQPGTEVEFHGLAEELAPRGE